MFNYVHLLTYFAYLLSAMNYRAIKKVIGYFILTCALTFVVNSASMPSFIATHNSAQAQFSEQADVEQAAKFVEQAFQRTLMAYP